MIADYHALDSLDDEKSYLQAIYETTRWLLAIGLHPEKSVIFRQSHIAEHTELAWIFGALTPVGELQRMTQYKEKSVGKTSIVSTLLTYPLLMAADVLIYKATLVPVGEDQVQHLELTRTIARKFNRRFGQTFPEPKPILSKAPRIMSLKDPAKKMSKTGDEGIALLDSPEQIRRKIMTAPTATESGQKTMPAGVENLFTLLQGFAPQDVEQFKKSYNDGALKYVDLKAHLAEKIIETLKPLQQNFHQISNQAVQETLQKGALKAQPIAQTTLREVKEKIGLI